MGSRAGRETISVHEYIYIYMYIYMYVVCFSLIYILTPLIHIR